MLTTIFSIIIGTEVTLIICHFVLFRFNHIKAIKLLNDSNTEFILREIDDKKSLKIQNRNLFYRILSFTKNTGDWAMFLNSNDSMSSKCLVPGPRSYYFIYFDLINVWPVLYINKKIKDHYTLEEI